MVVRSHPFVFLFDPFASKGLLPSSTVRKKGKKGIHKRLSPWETQQQGFKRSNPTNVFSDFPSLPPPILFSSTRLLFATMMGQRKGISSPLSSSSSLCSPLLPVPSPRFSCMACGEPCACVSSLCVPFHATRSSFSQAKVVSSRPFVMEGIACSSCLRCFHTKCLKSVDNVLFLFQWIPEPEPLLYDDETKPTRSSSRKKQSPRIFFDSDEGRTTDASLCTRVFSSQQKKETRKQVTVHVHAVCHLCADRWLLKNPQISRKTFCPLDVGMRNSWNVFLRASLCLSLDPERTTAHSRETLFLSDAPKADTPNICISWKEMELHLAIPTSGSATPVPVGTIFTKMACPNTAKPLGFLLWSKGKKGEHKRRKGGNVYWSRKKQLKVALIHKGKKGLSCGGRRCG
mmetsp:Transcript_34193/g.88278  ORF Transcript_34193/g.88278 Transcript_34193/m.88278 type:complete len:401 (-) Transcript_34193:2773-3975(-)